MAFGIIIIAALFAFEIFNYSTTDFALRDLLGDLRFAGFRWATILSLAFCGIDFAGIARLFTPEEGSAEPNEVWYLFGAWLLAATMNAILTWWGVSMAIVNHQMQSTTMIDPSLMVKVVPVFVAIMVWLIRILIIGSLSYAGERMFAQADVQVRPMVPSLQRRPSQGVSLPANQAISAAPQTPYPVRPAPKPVARPESGFNRSEPTYQSLSMRSGGTGNTTPRSSDPPPSPHTRR